MQMDFLSQVFLFLEILILMVPLTWLTFGMAKPVRLLDFRY